MDASNLRIFLSQSQPNLTFKRDAFAPHQLDTIVGHYILTKKPSSSVRLPRPFRTFTCNSVMAHPRRTCSVPNSCMSCLPRVGHFAWKSLSFFWWTLRSKNPPASHRGSRHPRSHLATPPPPWHQHPPRQTPSQPAPAPATDHRAVLSTSPGTVDQTQFSISSAIVPKKPISGSKQWEKATSWQHYARLGSAWMIYMK